MFNRLRRWLRDRFQGSPKPAEPPEIALRQELAARFLHGNGIELGALHHPLPVPSSVNVTYVDRLPNAALRDQYPELADRSFSRIDVIDDGERLTKFADASLDFIIASNFIEHAQDPIGTLKSHLRVLKPGGILFLGVPNRRLTFDRDRPPTTWEHVRRDHLEGPAGSYESHVREYAEMVDGCVGPALEKRIAFLRSTNYSLHFHVWDDAEFRAFLEQARDAFELPFTIEAFENNFQEFVVILKRTGP